MCVQFSCVHFKKDVGKVERIWEGVTGKDMKIVPPKERLRRLIFLSYLKRRIKDYWRKRSVIIMTLWSEVRTRAMLGSRSQPWGSDPGLTVGVIEHLCSFSIGCHLLLEICGQDWALKAVDLTKLQNKPDNRSGTMAKTMYLIFSWTLMSLECR